jgi:hypothetical protein
MGALADVTEGFAFRDERYFAERRRQAAGKVAHLDGSATTVGRAPLSRRVESTVLACGPMSAVTGSHGGRTSDEVRTATTFGPVAARVWAAGSEANVERSAGEVRAAL